MGLKEKRKVSQPAIEQLSAGRAPLWKSASAVPSLEKEKVRRWIVTLIFIVYWLLIFEGVLRKWALPGLHKFLFFIRDPFVLITYFLAIKYKMWPRWTGTFTVGMALGVLFFVLALIQGLALDLSPTIVIYGWRNYFFYLPFAFIIGEQFRGKDLLRLVRHSLLVSIPIAVLCYQQFKAPAEDAINGSYSANSAMLVARGIVRTSGTFTVSAAQTLFIGSMLAMLLAAWLLPRSQRPLKRIPLWLASGAVLTMVAVSGARSVFLQVAAIFAAAFVSMIVLHRFKFRVKPFLILVAILVLGAVGYVKLFPTAFGAMVDRQMGAQYTEGTWYARVLNSSTSLVRAIPLLTVMGSGLGSGTNAAAMLSPGGNGLTVEDEMQHVVVECGIFGLIYMAYRYWLTWWLGRGAFFATRRAMNPLPFLFFGFEAVTLMYGQMTIQGTINGYGWLFAGFCMAANRLNLKPTSNELT